MFEVTNVGFDVSSLQMNNSVLSGTCTVYSTKNNEDFEDDYKFTYDKSTLILHIINLSDGGWSVDQEDFILTTLLENILLYEISAVIYNKITTSILWDQYNLIILIELSVVHF